MKKVRILLATLCAALILPACASLPGLGDSISKAQLQELEYRRDLAQIQAAERNAEREFEKVRLDAAAATIKSCPSFTGATNDMLHAWALASCERVALAQMQSRAALQGGQSQTRQIVQQAPQDGPIVTVLKAVAPYVIPGLQLLAQDRQSQRGHVQALANMDLIDAIVGEVAKPPLIVTPPDPIILDREVPIIIDREVPIIIDRDVPVFVPPASAD